MRKGVSKKGVIMFTTSSIGALEEAIRFSTAKQKAISSNLANVDTPNYKEQSVSFNRVLEQTEANASVFQSKQTDERHLHFPLPSGYPHASHNKQGQYNHNGNSVDVDKQMTEMAENQLYYNAVVDRMTSSFQSLETAIRGGR